MERYIRLDFIQSYNEEAWDPAGVPDSSVILPEGKVFDEGDN